MVLEETMNNQAVSLSDAEMLPQLALMPIGVDYYQSLRSEGAGRQDEGLHLSVLLSDDEDGDEEDMDEDENFDDMDDDFDDDFDDEDDFDEEDEDYEDEEEDYDYEEDVDYDDFDE